MNVTTPSTLVNTLRARIVALTPSGGTTYGERATYRAIEDDDWMAITPKNAADKDKIAAQTKVVVRGNERIPAARPGAPSRVTWSVTK